MREREREMVNFVNPTRRRKISRLGKNKIKGGKGPERDVEVEQSDLPLDRFIHSERKKAAISFFIPDVVTSLVFYMALQTGLES